MRPTTSNPIERQSRTAVSLLLTTKIELHRAETTRPRPFERMRAHGARHAFPARIRHGNVAAIGDMQAATGAIGTQVVRADNAAHRPSATNVSRSDPIQWAIASALVHVLGKREVSPARIVGPMIAQNGGCVIL
jgi:hypothetical protein